MMLQGLLRAVFIVCVCGAGICFGVILERRRSTKSGGEEEDDFQAGHLGPDVVPVKAARNGFE